MASSQRREPSALATASARLFETLSRVRGKRVFHPHGVGFAATLDPLGGENAGGSALGRESEAIVRLSRGLGLPEWLPDPCGLALRVPDAYGPARHQDLLLVSSGSAPVARHTISPARGVLDRPYSTVLPYRLDGRLVVFAALPETGSGRGPKLAELRERGAGGLAFELAFASPGGTWQRFARLVLGERLDAAESERLDFDPTNTGGGLELAGFLNRLRGPSYRASQAGREEAYREGATDVPDAPSVSRGASAA